MSLCICYSETIIWKFGSTFATIVCIRSKRNLIFAQIANCERLMMLLYNHGIDKKVDMFLFISPSI